METNALTYKARAVASCLSYNGNLHEATAKECLIEMARRLDALDVRVHKGRGGLQFVNGSGKSRYATVKELALYWLFGVLPREV